MKPYLTKSELAEAISISESTVDEMVRRGVIPPPARLSSGCVRWRWEMVDRALASLIPGSHASAPEAADEGVRRAIEAAKGQRRGRVA